MNNIEGVIACIIIGVLFIGNLAWLLRDMFVRIHFIEDCVNCRYYRGANPKYKRIEREIDQMRKRSY